MSTDGIDHRLSGDVLAHHYRLTIRPDVESGTFTGSVNIDLECRGDTDSITLHSLGLRIERASVQPEGAEAIPATVDIDEEHEWIILSLPALVPAGSAELRIEYSGEFCDQLVGMYSSTFDSGGESHQLVVTQCESTHARRILPCFDEPEFKARFGVTLVVQEDLTAVSNAAEMSRRSVGDGLVEVTFADTVRMSTYLLAMVVGPLEVTEPRLVPGRDGAIPLRVVHPPGQRALCDFALEVAEAALLFFEDYYDLPYPGDKVDLVAVPDFAFGAMENMGCITFREVLLLVDPDSATPQELQRVADVINHELAHMWFGNLVTMKWWNGIWLNEAFATFMEVTASNDFRPEWDVWTTFGLARAAAFETDALRSTRPIEFDVETAADSEAMFDILTYEKGCSVVRMLEQYLGPRRFRDGIRAYLRINAWGNTETTDLWDALEDSSGEPVRRIMDEWIFNGGHPLVSVRQTDSGVHLEQSRALVGAEASGTSGNGTAGTVFPIPMVLESATAGSAPESHRLLLEGPETLELDGPPTWVQPNAGGNAFFRSLLDKADRRRLAPVGSPLERFVLVDDAWFAMRGGHIDLPDALDTVDAVVTAGEDEPPVWRRIGGTCADLARLAGDNHRAAAADWVRELLAGPLEHFPAIPAASGKAAEVAATVLVTSGHAGDDRDSVDRSRELFTSPGVDPALAAGALEVVARHATASEHEEIERRWRESATPQDEQRNLAALVLTADETCFARALELMRTDVRTQDAPYVLRRALTNPTLGPTAWEFLVGHWDEIVARFPSGSLPRMLEGIRSFTDGELASGVSTFLTAHPLQTGTMQVDQHIEAMQATVIAAVRVRAGGL